jgi:hypothetical protein
VWPNEIDNFFGSYLANLNEFVLRNAFWRKGGAIFIGARSQTEVWDSSFLNNRAGMFGGALYDGFNNNQITMQGNEGCGNHLSSGASYCNGVSLVDGGCLEFQNQCNAPTHSPAGLSPTFVPAPTVTPRAGLRTASPTGRRPSDAIVTLGPTTFAPSIAPRSGSGNAPSTATGSASTAPSPHLSEPIPSTIPSDIASNNPSAIPASSPTLTPTSSV